MAEKENEIRRRSHAIKDARGRPAILGVLSYPFRQAWGAFQYVDGAYLRGHAELELFPTARDRRRAVRRVVAKFLWRQAFWSTVGKAVVLAILLALLALAVLAALRTWHPLPIIETCGTCQGCPWSIRHTDRSTRDAQAPSTRHHSRRRRDRLSGMRLCLEVAWPRNTKEDLHA